MTQGEHTQINAEQGAEPIRTLVVDDSQQWLEVVCDFLRKHPRIELVGTASDGLAALGRVATLHPEAVVLDVRMPRMGGLEAAALIRARFPQTRILMMSTDDDITMDEIALTSGADAFVTKGTAATALLPALFRICGRVSAQATTFNPQPTTPIQAI